MALNSATTPLVISATQGSADAFVQGSVITGLSGRQAYNLKQIAFELTTTQVSGWTATNAWVEACVSRRSKTAMPNLSDNDVIYKWAFQFMIATSGGAIFPRTHVYVFPLEVPLVEETLYLVLDSTSTAVVQSCVARLEVELDTISDIDRLNLITRSLT